MLRHRPTRLALLAAAVLGLLGSLLAYQQLMLLRASRSTSTGAEQIAQTTTPLELHARLRRDAAATAVSLDTRSEPAGPGVVSDRLIAVGPQPAILAFAERVETRVPAARFTSWAIEGDPAGVRLRAVVVTHGAGK